MYNKESGLIEKIKSGDSGAFEELYKLHYFALSMYAKLMLNEGESEDVVQDVFLNLWTHRDLLNESLPIRAYLFRSVYNASLNVLRKKRRTESYDSIYSQEIEEIGAQHFYNPDANNVIMDLYARDARTKIYTAIKSLPPRCQEIFSLSFIDDLSGKEISKRLGISLSTVENHINNALKLLRKKLLSHKNDMYLLSIPLINEFLQALYWVFFIS